MSVSSAKSAGSSHGLAANRCRGLINATGLTAIEKRQRIDDEAGNDVELDFRPQRPIGIHGRHQPVEAIVALHRHAQRSGMTLGQAGHVPSRFGHLRQHRSGQGE